MGLSQQQLARMIGVTYQQAHKYERGLNRISAGRLFEIAQVLGVGVSWFFEGLSAESEQHEISPRQRMCLELARNFAMIDNEKHQEALSQMARALAAQSQAAAVGMPVVPEARGRGRDPLTRGPGVARPSRWAEVSKRGALPAPAAAAAALVGPDGAAGAALCLVGALGGVVVGLGLRPPPAAPVERSGRRAAGGREPGCPAAPPHRPRRRRRSPDTSGDGRPACQRCDERWSRSRRGSMP